MKALRTLSWALCATALVLFLMAAFPGQVVEAWNAFSNIVTWNPSGGSNATIQVNGVTIATFTARGCSLSLGKKADVDTLKAKVVATTAMSEYIITPAVTSVQSSVGWTADPNSYYGLYAVGASDVCRFTFPHRYINGAKVIMDSIVYWRQLLTATDTLLVSMGSTDTVGLRTVVVGYDTTKGTGSKALLRKARAVVPVDTAAYNRTLHFEFITKTLTDTCFLRQIHFKYHTIPGP